MQLSLITEYENVHVSLEYHCHIKNQKDVKVNEKKKIMNRYQYQDDRNVRTKGFKAIMMKMFQ